LSLWFKIALFAADSAAKVGAESNGSVPVRSVWMIWVGIAVLAVIVDVVICPKPISLWYAVGAIAALIASFLGVGLLLQGLIFAVFSFAALLVASYLKNLKTSKSLENNVIPEHVKKKLKLENIVNQEGIVVKTIDPERHENGLVKVAGIILPARSLRNQKIKAGTDVVIKAVKQNMVGGFAQFIGGTNSSRYILIVMPKEKVIENDVKRSGGRIWDN